MNNPPQNLIPPDDPTGTGQPETTEADDDAICECEQPGYFYSGVPGIIARMEDGRLAEGATVERCDLCQRYRSDAEALVKLQELGIA
ncbi:MAG TPA: hypothetical protein VGM05_03640 [Planctomycetaceae bacterium]|jgi:hypothetical protein